MIKVYRFDNEGFGRGRYVFVEGVDLFGVSGVSERRRSEKFNIGEVDENMMVLSRKIEVKKEWDEMLEMEMVVIDYVEGYLLYKMKIKEVKERVERYKRIVKELGKEKVVEVRGKKIEFVDWDICECRLLGDDVKLIEVV